MEITKLQKVVGAAVILDSQNRILLVKRSENDVYLPGYWGMPGGKIEFGETLNEGLKREVFEEIGFKVEVGYPLLVKSFELRYEISKDRFFYEIFCLCNVKDDKQVPKLSGEHSDFKWVSLENIILSPITEYMKNVISEIKNHPLLKL